MSDDLVKRLRGLSDCDARAGEPLGKCMREAADEIERLRKAEEYILKTLELANENCHERNREIKRLRAEVERLRKERDEALARPRYRHKKRGSIYTYEGVARLQTETPLTDMAQLVIYRSTEGELWARPPSEFNDGRFELLATQEDQR